VYRVGNPFILLGQIEPALRGTARGTRYFCGIGRQLQQCDDLLPIPRLWQLSQ
jgi:hypothetical protein